MRTQLHLVYGVATPRPHTDQEQVLLRDVQLARQDARRARRADRASRRRR